MSFIINNKITIPLLLMLSFSTSIYAESTLNLPTSTQITNNSGDNEEIEILEEVVIQTGDDSERGPELKEGIACDDSDLPAAELQPDNYQDIPMAETIPCDKVDCKDLEPAKLSKDNFKKLPMAKTIKGCIKKKK